MCINISQCQLRMTITSNPQYPSFLDQDIKIFIRILEDGEPQFNAEKATHIFRVLPRGFIVSTSLGIKSFNGKEN
nr:transcription-associated protein 1-like [Parasteatoda tepidariorum]